MSSTEVRSEAPGGASADELALSAFDEIIAPMAASLRARGAPGRFPKAGDPGAASYFEAPSLAVMGPEDFAFPGDGTAEGLIDALGKLWSERGEQFPATLLPRLKAVAAALQQEADENDGEVDILCYTMF